MARIQKTAVFDRKPGHMRTDSLINEVYMHELTDEEKRILVELEKAQKERESIPPEDLVPITNPDKYSFPVGINENVILCPYCMEIISENTNNCPHCNKDITKDAPIEMTFDEYQKIESKRSKKDDL
jgi:hypothetical protein